MIIFKNNQITVGGKLWTYIVFVECYHCGISGNCGFCTGNMLFLNFLNILVLGTCKGQDFCEFILLKEVRVGSTERLM